MRKNGEKERVDALDGAKILDTVIVISKSISQHTRHLRDRLEPETTERGAGMYLPEELVGYTISAMEVAQRGVGADPSSSSSLTGSAMMVDALSESQTRMIKGLLAWLTRLVALQFKIRPDEGRDAIRQAAQLKRSSRGYSTRLLQVLSSSSAYKRTKMFGEIHNFYNVVSIHLLIVLINNNLVEF